MQEHDRLARADVGEARPAAGDLEFGHGVASKEATVCSGPPDRRNAAWSDPYMLLIIANQAHA